MNNAPRCVGARWIYQNETTCNIASMFPGRDNPVKVKTVINPTLAGQMDRETKESITELS